MSESSESVKDLAKEAKWASDSETQKESIEELASHGQEAIPVLEDVKTVTAHEDIRQEVESAIRDIQRENSTDTMATPQMAEEKEAETRKRTQKSSKRTSKKNTTTSASRGRGKNTKRKSTARVSKAKNKSKKKSARSRKTAK